MPSKILYVTHNGDKVISQIDSSDMLQNLQTLLDDDWEIDSVNTCSGSTAVARSDYAKESSTLKHLIIYHLIK